MISYEKRMHLLLEHEYLKQLRKAKSSNQSQLSYNKQTTQTISDVNKDSPDFLMRITYQEPPQKYKSEPQSIHTSHDPINFKTHKRELFHKLQLVEQIPEFKFSFDKQQQGISQSMSTKPTSVAATNEFGESVPPFLTTLLKNSQMKNVKIRKRKQKLKRRPILMIEDIVSQRRQSLIT